MRIFVGTTEIAGQIPLFAAGFRALGHEVTTGVHIGHSYKFNTSLVYDIGVDMADAAQANRIIDEHDVFLFQFGHSLLWNNADFRMIKRAGKKIISLFNGSDVRYWPAYEQQFGIDYRTLNNEEPPGFWGIDSLPAVLGTLRRAELYADIIISAPNQSVLGLRPYNHFFYPVDVDSYKFNVPCREVPTVVHAPSKKQVKGTSLIINALDALKADGVDFTFRLLHDVSNPEVIAYLSDADCIIDQIYLGYGLFAVEGMLSGCAAATAHFPHLEAFASKRPILPLHVATLKDNLRELLTNIDLRIRLAHEGYAHAKAYHSNVAVCRRILDALDEKEMYTFDYWPRFCASEAVLPEGINISYEIKKMSNAVVARHGLPDDADVEEMVRRGFLSSDMLGQNVPRWSTTVRDCARYGASLPPPVRRVPCALPATCYWKRLFDDRTVNMIELCYNGRASKGLAHMISRHLMSGNRHDAILLLVQQAQRANPKAEILASLGFLLWGNGQIDAAANIFCALPKTEEHWNMLARWLLSIYELDVGTFAKGMQLLHGVRSALPSIGKHVAYCALSPEDEEMPQHAGIVLDWKRPTFLPRESVWISPAALTPDWCSASFPNGMWPVLIFQLLHRGFDAQINKTSNRAMMALREILRHKKSDR